MVDDLSLSVLHEIAAHFEYAVEVQCVKYSQVIIFFCLQTPKLCALVVALRVVAL